MDLFKNIWIAVTGYSLSDYGSWASIIGLFISLVTLVLVKRLKKSFMFRARVDVQGDFLQEKSAELSGLLATYQESADEITEILTKVKVKLRALNKGAKGDLGDDISKAIEKIEVYLKDYWERSSSALPPEKNVREIYSLINIIVEELDNVKSELVVGS
ncbi:hypothetical protein [Vibrio alginolyticus]|uniref:hypothetical protein n=1 Tax=Vibrio alginolyticus TaxID=663 RepID=UPI001110CD1C|nr:hypothetical protein [Vibrio alginolyticus]TMX48011.1 hypothetical protein DA091_24430 [Vibrio alginolyticus]